jgi:hypothetical protein
MKRLRISLLSIAALAVLVVPGMMRDANAGVRVKATVHTPNVTVRIGNTPSSHYRSFVRKPLPTRRVYRHVIITQQDRKIARRLARYTGVPARELIFLKSRGFTWVTIGRWLELPRGTVRAAMNQRSWNQFLRHERQLACCGDTICRGHHIVRVHGDTYVDEYDDDYYDD